MLIRLVYVPHYVPALVDTVVSLFFYMHSSLFLSVLLRGGVVTKRDLEMRVRDSRPDSANRTGANRSQSKPHSLSCSLLATRSAHQLLACSERERDPTSLNFHSTRHALARRPLRTQCAG